MHERIVAVALALLVPAVASAKSERSTHHTYDQVWPTAVRHLRVDEGFKIVDKDADTGYVVFEMTDGGKVFAGALEVVKFQDDDRQAVRLVMTIADRPDYMEAAVLDRLLAKLRKEHGDPPPPPEKKEPPRKPAKPKK